MLDKKGGASMAMQGEEPLFSIVVPVYNGQSYLTQTLESISSQTCNDYEVILVDDGSTDASGDICDAYARAHKMVTVIHQRNEGSLLARRAAFVRSRGKYIVTLDSDDMLRMDSLTKLSKIIVDCDPDIIVFPFSRNRDFRIFGPSRYDLTPGFYTGSEYAEFKFAVCSGGHNNMCGKCCKRSTVDMETDYTAYRGLAHAEDLLQLLPLVDTSRSFYYLEDALYYYRPNPTSSTACYKRRQFMDLKIVIDELLRYADSWGNSYLDEARRGALMQISFLIHMLATDKMNYQDKLMEIESIRSYVLNRGLIGTWCDSMRLDKRLEIRELKRGNLGALVLIVRLLVTSKRFIERRMGVLDANGNVG